MVVENLEGWLQENYTSAFRTAVLILRNRSDAEEAVQEAFLRAWRFRDSVADPAAFRPWLFRVLVNACRSKLRQEIRHRDRRADDATLVELSGTRLSPEEAAGRADVAGRV